MDKARRQPRLFGLLKEIHHDEGGAVSLENLLILAAIVLPILIFVIKIGWPRIKDYFTQRMQDIEDQTGNATQ